MTYAVLACSRCRSFWIANDHRRQETATCSVCGHRHPTKRPRVRFEHDDRDVACEVRSRLLAENADRLEAYDALDDYGVLGDQVAERITDQVDQFAELVDDRPIFSDAFGSELGGDLSELLAEEAEAYLDRSQKEFDEAVRAATGASPTSTPGVASSNPASNGLQSHDFDETGQSASETRAGANPPAWYRLFGRSP